MNIKKVLPIMIAALILIFTPFAVFGANVGFETKNVTQNEKSRIISQTKIKLLNSEPARDSIVCFDVNENGLIALGTENHEQKTIAVYTSKGEFLYGLSFNDSGSFGVEWDNENLNIYLVRGDLEITVDKAGEIKEVYIIKNTDENNSYWNNVIFSDTRNINGVEYKIDNDLGILNLMQSSYSRLVVTTSPGAETVLYDVSDSQLLYSIFWMVAVILIVTIAITAIAKQWKKSIIEQKKNDELNNSIIINAFESNKQE